MNKTASAALAAAVLATAGGVAIAGQVSGEPQATVARNAPIAPPAGPGNRGAAHQTSAAALREHLDRGDEGYLKDVNWKTARSFTVPGTELRGWTFIQPGKRCIAIPDPLAEGYGVTCKTPREITAGEGSVLMLTPTESGKPILAGIMVSGTQTATVQTPGKTAARWERTGDVYAGTVPAGSRLASAGMSRSIDPEPAELVPPATPTTP